MSEVKTTKREIKLGKQIKKYRRLAGLTQEQLADRVRVSTTHIGLVETGKRRISLKTLQKIASTLEVKVNEILPY